MAQKVQVLLVDDVDGSEATSTVKFALDGLAYEIDLSDAHAAELRVAFGPWIASARKAAGSSAGARGPRRASSGPSADVIREWAKANGHFVSDRGRISQAVRTAYDAAH
ncbi:MAG: Lsr2 family protein [Cellulomonadaceae bacterium]|nr:Lsr2 family protein [Cellulomonadaceae bacterium]